MIGQWLGNYAGDWFGNVSRETVQPSGGWYWPHWWKRKKGEDEELADALEAHLLAEGVIAAVEPPQVIAAYMAVTPPESVPEHVRNAIKRAVRSQTDAAYRLAMKRIREMEEEEDFVVLMALH